MVISSNGLLVGSKVVIASTDFKWDQAETARIVQCDSCTNKQVRIDRTYIYIVLFIITDNTVLSCRVF